MSLIYLLFYVLLWYEVRDGNSKRFYISNSKTDNQAGVEDKTSFHKTVFFKTNTLYNVYYVLPFQ